MRGIRMLLGRSRPTRSRRGLSLSPCSRPSKSSKPPPIHRHGSLLLQSKDTLGIVSAVSDVVLKHGLNMTGADLHVEKGARRSTAKPEHDTFICRFSFETNENATIGDKGNNSPFAFDDADITESFNLHSFEEHLSQVVTKFHAESTLLHQSGRLVKFDGRKAQRTVLRSSGPARMAVFASKRDHCVNDLIDKCRGGELPVNIVRVISNFERTEANSHVYRALSRLNIPYHYVPCSDSGRDREDWENEIMHIMQSEAKNGQYSSHHTDFIVLARFMQILSPDFLRWYAPLPIINIHHGLLPSFKGSNPYRQAFEAGVKLIGATAHLVTDELDEGPIIVQTTKPVTHRDSIRDVRLKSERIEADALHDAVRLVAENRVARVGGRTIVFE